MSRSRYRIPEDEYPYFLTCTAVAWLPVFAWAAEIVLKSWRFLQRECQVRLLGYVILENHLHWLAAAPGLARRVGALRKTPCAQRAQH